MTEEGSYNGLFCTILKKRTCKFPKFTGVKLFSQKNFLELPPPPPQSTKNPRTTPTVDNFFFGFFSKNQLTILENHCKSSYSFRKAFARSARYFFLFFQFFLDFSGFVKSKKIGNYPPTVDEKSAKKRGYPPQSRKIFHKIILLIYPLATGVVIYHPLFHANRLKISVRRELTHITLENYPLFATEKSVLRCSRHEISENRIREITNVHFSRLLKISFFLVTVLSSSF